MMVVNTIALSVALEINFRIWKSDMDLTLAPEVHSQNTLMKKVAYSLIRLPRQTSGLEAINLIFMWEISSESELGRRLVTPTSAGN